MFKDNRYINAGVNEIYRYGKKAVEKVSAHLQPNEAVFYSFPVDGGKYWTIGTSSGKYGEFAKINDTIFSANSAGFMYAKAGTEKAEKFVEAITGMVDRMQEMNAARAYEEEE